MFTGIITNIGTIQSKRKTNAMYELAIHVADMWNDVVLGESIAVNGVCLTVTKISSEGFTADVSVPTIESTSIGDLTNGARVNLERAVRLGDRMGGHLVQGHVDGIANLLSVEREANNVYLTFRIDQTIFSDLILKGSVAVDGVSLTVQRLERDSFTVVVIPHTFESTTFSTLKTNAPVNIETDVISKYVKKHCAAEAQPPLTIELIKKMGF